MFSISQSDLLQALKKYRRLAKQDVLISAHAPNPQFWRLHAETRRTQYKVLMEIVAAQGIEPAYQYSVSEYIALPLIPNDNQDPVLTGMEQAFETVFLTLGINTRLRTRLRNARRKVQRNWDGLSLQSMSDTSE